jgi:hypothetical protein
MEHPDRLCVHTARPFLLAASQTDQSDCCSTTTCAPCHVGPQRERRGWMGDAHMSSNEAILNSDMHAFYRNFLALIRDDQLIGCAAAGGTGGSACANPALHKGSVADVTPFTTGASPSALIQP